MGPGLAPATRPGTTMALLHPQLRISHHLRPFLDLALDARAKLLRRVGDRNEAERCELLLYIRLRNRLRDLLLKQADDLLGRTRRHDESGQGVRVLILDALLGKGWLVGKRLG